MAKEEMVDHLSEGIVESDNEDLERDMKKSQDGCKDDMKLVSSNLFIFLFDLSICTNSSKNKQFKSQCRSSTVF